LGGGDSALVVWVNNLFGLQQQHFGGGSQYLEY